MQLEKLLELMLQNEASDLHLCAGSPPVLRIDGRLRRLDRPAVEQQEMAGLVGQIVPERSRGELELKGGSDFAFSFGQARFRVSVFRQRGAVSLALRLLPSKFLTFEETGLPAAVKNLLMRARGLFLVTGPTGSGKTTTLATMVNFINEELDRHIVTVEDPVEYCHPHKQSLVTQREVGTDVESFAEALKRVLRQDPDVILVGEMRDLETMSAAVTAAETGHLVFATLHTIGAAETINRVVDAFPRQQQEQVRIQLSTCLLAVLSQVLLPRANGSGRVAAFEVMINSPAIAHLIRENRTHQIISHMQTGRKAGMMLLDDSLWALFTEGKVGFQAVMDKAVNPEELQQRVRQLSVSRGRGGK